MTELLQQAIAKIQTLSDDEQESIATIILEELEDERKWEKAFADSQDVLAKLASELEFRLNIKSKILIYKKVVNGI